MEIVTVTVGPLVAADDDGWGLLQGVYGAQGVAFNGAKATGFSATNIAQAQAVAGAADLTLNGTLVNGGVAYLTSPALAARSVAITSAGDDTGITFTVYGAVDIVPGFGYMMGSETITGADTDVAATRTRFYTVTRIAASGAAAGNVSAGTNGYVVTDKPRRAAITSAGNDADKTFTISGLDWSGNPISEVLTGAAAGVAQSVYDYSAVYSIVASAEPAAGISVGTNGVASSRPIFMDRFCFSPTSLQVVVSGTVNYTVSQSLDAAEIQPQYVDQPPTNNYTNVTWINYPDSVFVAATATAQGNYAYIPNMTRITLNSGSGSVTYKVLQAASPT